MRSIRRFIRRLRSGKNRSDIDTGAVPDSSLSLTRVSELSRLETSLGYSFQDQALLERSLTHRSFVHRLETPEPDRGIEQDYESLEFFGDAILGFVVSEFLFLTYPTHPEGELSRIKSFLVSTDQLAHLSHNLRMGDFVRLSYGEEKTGGRNKRAILADLFESVTAAIYLDGGIDATREFILSQLRPHLQRIAEEKFDFKDHKSTLQEQVHLMGFSVPHYQVVDELGPDHKKEFTVEVRVNGKFLARASGRSKKEAQQHAAQLAIETLDQVL